MWYILSVSGTILARGFTSKQEAIDYWKGQGFTPDHVFIWMEQKASI
jgi:hypothetical protein